ncbi:MAG: SDR family NAD(P)-dependent oxidoreductase [Anaerobacillus sp.]
MMISGNTVLITGGGSGIGLALAERFLAAKNEVIIVGRNEEKLEHVRSKHPEIHTRTCDVSKQEDRANLLSWIKAEFPALNILVNNAGIQERANLLKEDNDWSRFENELNINIDGPLHLSMLFTPLLMEKERSSIINISSGLALTPGAWVPVYSATKAALHSFTQSLRLQLADTSVSIVEVFPPAVNTDLGGPGLHTFGAPLNDFADEIFEGIKGGSLEIGYGDSANRLNSSLEELKKSTEQMWQGFKRNNPDF